MDTEQIVEALKLERDRISPGQYQFSKEPTALVEVLTIPERVAVAACLLKFGRASLLLLSVVAGPL